MVRRVFKLNDQIKALAEDLKVEQSCLMFGRGRNYATALEAALKVCVGGVFRVWERVCRCVWVWFWWFAGQARCPSPPAPLSVVAAGQGGVLHAL